MGFKSKEREKEYLREYYLKNRDRILKRCRKYFKENKEKKYASTKRRLKEQKDIFLEMYGNKCSCCEETQKEFLVLDHVNGIGRKRMSAYSERKLAIDNYDSGEYRILCHNCNASFGIYGYCPHQKGNENVENI